MALEKKVFVTPESYECPACSNATRLAHYLYVDPVLSLEAFLLRCPSCSLLFARPVLIPELEDRQMDTLDDAEMFGSQLMKSLHEHLYIKKEIATVRRLGLKSGHLLDVGCGAGWISNIWAKKGFDVTGLEPSEPRGRFARERYGLNVVNGYIEHAEFDQGFDMVILRHVIEHFQNPTEMMKKVRGTLEEKGLVLVVVPNIDCIGRYLFDTDWEWVLPWHCNFFNKKSLASLMEHSGFEVLKIYQTASPFYYFESLARRLDSRSLEMVNRNFKVASMLSTSPLALIGRALGLGDNLTIIARVKL